MLKEASLLYNKISETLKKFTEIFPFAFEGEFNIDSRLKGVRLLRKLPSIERKSLSLLQEALSNWNIEI